MEALMIGVSGMRGTVGGLFNPVTVNQMASAFAAWLKDTKKPRGGTHFRVVFGRDSRPSGVWTRDAVVAALTASGIEVIDLDIAMTPSVLIMVQHLGADAGIIASASHNPVQWNGLKLISGDGLALPPADGAIVKRYYEEQKTSYAPVLELVPPVKNGEANALHVKRVLAHVDALGIGAKRFKVVLDSVNGAGGIAAAMLLGKLGCEVVHLNSSPTGLFPHEPEPLEQNLRGLCDEVKKHRAHVGFAQDPDADRLAIVDERGTYIGEEYTPVLGAMRVLKKKPGTVVVNVSTTRMIDDLAAQTGSKVIRTKVGEANVVQGMVQSGATVGGEGGGGMIDRRVVSGRDSLTGMGWVLQLMADTGKTVSQLCDELPHYQFVKTKFECRREDADRAIAALKEAFGREKIATQDGIRIDFEAEKMWVQARPSNTEPIMRVVGEGPDRALVEQRVKDVQAVVDRTLKG